MEPSVRIRIDGQWHNLTETDAQLVRDSIDDQLSALREEARDDLEADQI